MSPFIKSFGKHNCLIYETFKKALSSQKQCYLISLKGLGKNLFLQSDLYLKTFTDSHWVWVTILKNSKCQKHQQNI